MGGNVKSFKVNTEPISAKIAPQIQEEICEKIKSKYSNIELIKIGSVGHKRDDDFHSDIDVAIKCDTIENLRDIISDCFGNCSIVNIETFYIVSAAYSYIFENQEKYVQCDFMLVHNISYTKFRYDCPNYKINESNYKVGHKIMFMNMILNHCKEKNDGCSKDQYGKYDYSPLGLYRNIINKTNYTQVKREFITDNIETIMHIPFNDDITYKDFISIESLWKAIHSDKFKYPEELKIIELNLFKNSYRKGWIHIKPEDFICDYWTTEQINKYLKIFKLEHILNNKLINNSEK